MKSFGKSAALLLSAAILLSASACGAASGAKAAEAAPNQNAAGKNNPVQTSFRAFIWTNTTDAGEGGEGTATYVTLKKSGKDPLKVELPWQLYELSSKLKNCVLTHSEVSASSDSPALDICYDIEKAPGTTDTESAQHYKWENGTFTYSGKFSESQSTWPLGKYESSQAAEVINTLYDKFSKESGLENYSPQSAKLDNLFSNGVLPQQIELVRVKHGEAIITGTASGETTNHTKLLTNKADIVKFIDKLNNCTLSKTSTPDNGYSYSLILKMENGSFYTWENNLSTTHGSFVPEAGIPIGEYYSVKIQKLIDSYYTSR